MIVSGAQREGWKWDAGGDHHLLSTGGGGGGNPHLERVNPPSQLPERERVVSEQIVCCEPPDRLVRHV